MKVAKINLIRIDSRLIHGQVITKWLKVTRANRIIIIDNNLYCDSFMSDVYMMAAPNGVSVEIYNVEEGIEVWNKNRFDNGNVLVLFKDVANCYEAFKKGFPMKEVQIGGLASAPGRTTVLRAVSFDSQDVIQLKEMEYRGVKLILHIIPEEPKVEFGEAIKKFKF